MKNLYLKSILLFLICFISFSSTTLAQSVSVANNYPNTLVKRVSGTISTQLERSTDFLDFARTFTWTVSPSTGVSFGGANNDASRSVIFGPTAAAGTYTVTVTGTIGWGTATTTVTLTDGSTTNLWAAKSIGTNTSRVEAFNVNAGSVVSGPSTLFYTGGEFAAMGRSPYPSPSTGYFYWIPYSAGTNGVLTVKGANGDGSGSTTVLGSFDIDPSSSANATFVRFALDKDGVGWTLTGIGGNLNLTKINFSGLGAASASIEDPNVNLAGGSIGTFQNGDLCLDGAGYIYALANITGGTTEIYIGQPNGASTTLTRKWEVKDAVGNNFTGSVNGCAFDSAGAMYISTANGIYYLDPGTIAPGGGTTLNTVRARLVSQQSDYTDLGTNVFPNSTTIPLPARFGALTATEQNGSIVVNWETLMEKDVKNFVVEASKDGATWHEIGRVNSKALNGNSDGVQSYQFIAGSSLALGAVSLALLLLIPVFRSRLLKASLAVLIIITVAVSCSKSDVIDVKKSETVFIRIAQYDIDSAEPTYSKVITVVKQ